MIMKKKHLTLQLFAWVVALLLCWSDKSSCQATRYSRLLEDNGPASEVPTLSPTVAPAPAGETNIFPPPTPPTTPTFNTPTTPTFNTPTTPTSNTPTTPTTPTQPTTPSAFADEEDDEDEKAGTFAVVVIVFLVLAILGAGCCIRRGGYDLVDNYTDPEQASQDFKNEIANSKWFVLRIPQGAISRRFACIKPCQKRTIPEKDFNKALFFSTRVKYRWNWLLASVQFALGWISLFSTIIALFAPDHRGNSVIGFAALFLSELILHFWYGFMRYPNLCSWILGVGDRDDPDNLFDDVSHIFGVLMHNGSMENHENNTLKWIGLPFTLVFHLASIAGFIGTLMGYCALAIAGAAADDDSNNKKKRKRRRKSSQEEELDMWGVIGMGALGGALLGSFFYPLIFLFSTSTGGKFAAVTFHHISSEYYEARLFHKSPKEFLQSIVTKFLTDVCDIDLILEGGDIDFVGEIADDEETGAVQLGEEFIGNVDMEGDEEKPKDKDMSETEVSSSHGDYSAGQGVLVVKAAPPLPLAQDVNFGSSSRGTNHEGHDDADYAAYLAEKAAKKAKKKKKKERKEREAAAAAAAVGALDASESNNTEDGDMQDRKKGKKERKERETDATESNNAEEGDTLDHDKPEKSSKKKKKKKKKKSSKKSSRNVSSHEEGSDSQAQESSNSASLLDEGSDSQVQESSNSESFLDGRLLKQQSEGSLSV